MNEHSYFSLNSSQEHLLKTSHVCFVLIFIGELKTANHQTKTGADVRKVNKSLKTLYNICCTDGNFLLILTRISFILHISHYLMAALITKTRLYEILMLYSVNSLKRFKIHGPPFIYVE